jgi:hypothetical protein
MSDFASEYAGDLEDLFTRYVRIDTQSDSRSSGAPSTRKQFDLLKLLKQELDESGASDVRVTENGFTIATIPATVEFDTPRLAFLAHVDTTALTPIRGGKFREPDLMLLLDANDPRRQNSYWLGADIVVEIVSEDDPERDTVVKCDDYAEGRIPGYWIVNPADETVTVLTLEDNEYAEHSIFKRGQVATSPLLPGFSAQVSAIFDAH